MKTQPIPWATIDALRRERGWNFNQLARKSGLSATHVRDCISGRRTPSPATIEALADAFDIPASDLLPPTTIWAHTENIYARLRDIDRLASHVISKLESAEMETTP